VLDFLLAHIDSVAELEALLLLRGAPGQTWTESQMSARLYISEPECANVFSRLELAGLCLRTADGIRYRTVIDSVSATVDRLADTYARCLIPVTNVIHHKPPQIQKFADAFIFRKGK
jgi:hypothetical protein